MIHLEKADHKNVWDIIELAPFESPYDFVAARDLYRSFGFVENGEMDEDEIVAVLKL